MPMPTNLGCTGITSPIQKSAFINSLELISLYKLWDVCDVADITLDDTLDWAAPKWERLKEALESVGTATSVLKMPNDVSRGFGLYSSISQASGSYRFFTSHICWSEMHHALLENIGLEGLVRQGVPLSLREKRPQLLYWHSLSDAEFAQLSDRILAFREALKLDYGMDVIEVEDPATGIGITSADIWDQARVLWSHVLLTAADAYVCAAAVLIQADVFVDGDSSRRDILQALRHPPDDWRAAAEAIRTALGLNSNEEFPLPVTPPRALP